MIEVSLGLQDRVRGEAVCMAARLAADDGCVHKAVGQAGRF